MESMHMEKIAGKNNLIVGIGSALVDILVKESDDFLVKTGAQKGGMTLVQSADFIDGALKRPSGNRRLCLAGRHAIPSSASAAWEDPRGSLANAAAMNSECSWKRL
jgi:hypothetical protein